MCGHCVTQRSALGASRNFSMSKSPCLGRRAGNQQTVLYEVFASRTWDRHPHHVRRTQIAAHKHT